MTIEERSKEFMLKRHKLYFDRLENLAVGSNFIHSAAEFATQEVKAERTRIADELNRLACEGAKGFEFKLSQFINQLRNGGTE